MNYEILTAELQNDPAGLGYATMTDAEVATAINATTQAARQLVPLWQIKKAAIESNLWLAIKNAAASHADAQVQGVANVTLDYISDSRFENLDMDLASTQAMLGALVAGGVVTQDFVDALDAMADTTTSRANVLGLGTVSDGHVKSARGN